MHFYWEKCLRHWEFCPAPDQRPDLTLQGKKLLPFLTGQEKYHVLWWRRKPKALSQTLPECLQSWGGQILTAQAMLAVGLTSQSSLISCCKGFPDYFLDWAPRWGGWIFPSFQVQSWEVTSCPMMTVGLQSGAPGGRPDWVICWDIPSGCVAYSPSALQGALKTPLFQNTTSGTAVHILIQTIHF